VAIVNGGLGLTLAGDDDDDGGGGGDDDGSNSSTQKIYIGVAAAMGVIWALTVLTTAILKRRRVPAKQDKLADAQPANPPQYK
jgi:hypothetical protein